jgi:hypothetical protein
MGATNTFERQIIRHFLRNTAQTPAATLYASCLTAVADEEAGSVTELGSTDRVAVAFDDDTAGVTQNTGDVVFEIGANGTVSHIGIYDASTSGNLLFVIALDDPEAVTSGQELEIAAGDLTVTLS